MRPEYSVRCQDGASEQQIQIARLCVKSLAIRIVEIRVTSRLLVSCPQGHMIQYMQPKELGSEITWLRVRGWHETGWGGGGFIALGDRCRVAYVVARTCKLGLDSLECGPSGSDRLITQQLCGVGEKVLTWCA